MHTDGQCEGRRAHRLRGLSRSSRSRQERTVGPVRKDRRAKHTSGTYCIDPCPDFLMWDGRESSEGLSPKFESKKWIDRAVTA